MTTIEQEQEKFMREDQLDFLVDRLNTSSAKVKLVFYSRQLSMSFLSLEQMAEERQKYVEIAVNEGFNTIDAGITYDKVVAAAGYNFVNGYVPWFTNEFIPRINGTGAKNVYFISGGNHTASLNRLVSNSPFIEVHTSAIGTITSGRSNQGIKMGQPNNDIVINYSKDFGFSDILVSPCNKTVTVTFIPVNSEKSSVTFPIV